MSWLKKFVNNVSGHPIFKWSGCTCYTCLGVFEAAVIISSAKKLKIILKPELVAIESHESGNYAKAPLFTQLNDQGLKNQILDDLLEELSDFTFSKQIPPRRNYSQNQTSDQETYNHFVVQKLIKPLIQILKNNGRTNNEIKASTLYSSLSKYLVNLID